MTSTNDPLTRFLPLARLALAGEFGKGDREELVEPLARLLEAASRGVGQLLKKDCRLPENHPKDFFATDGDLVLLPRYKSCWDLVRKEFEDRIAGEGGGPSLVACDDQNVLRELNAILPAMAEASFDNAQQRLAVAAFVDARAGVLTGGPGTGKTTCAAALLALRKRLDPSLAPGSVLISAPTGKAACRLAESLANAADRLPLTHEEKGFLKNLKPQTLHKALEWTPKQPEQGGPFARNATRPLDVELIVIDEASMVDLELMAHLVRALPPAATLILLGDSDQLESVETGGVLAELVERGAAGSLPADTLRRWSSRIGSDAAKVFADGLPARKSVASPLPGLAIGLRHSYRARESAWILNLAAIVKPGHAGTADAFRQLARAYEPNVRCYDHRADFDAFCHGQWESWSHLMGRWSMWNSAELIPQLGGHLAAFQLLCGSNAQVDRANRRGQCLLWGTSPQSPHILPHGCPLLVTSNRHSLGLSNGDIGVALGAGRGSAAQVAIFPGHPQPIPLAQLPQHQPAFALTIHKSQGSEWAEVALDLPGEESDLLDRNLLYTAITRASRRFHLFAEKNALERILG